MNTVVMIGRLTRDPELRYTPTGKPVCTFSIAVNRPHTKDKVDFFNIVVWNKPGENAATYLVKGQEVAVRGYLSTRSYDDKTGQKRWVTELVAGDVEYLAKPRSSNGDGTPFAPVDDYSADDFQQLDDDDIPFWGERCTRK